MPNKPFFTIITASYNNEKTIKKTLDSIYSQSFKNVEHIIIDGGSTDKTLSTILDYEKRYNLKWISEPDDGIADALNKGLNQTNGEYIIIIHADDYLDNPTILADAYKILNDTHYDIFSSPVFVEYPGKGKIIYKPITKLWWNHFKTIFPHQGCFVHKRLFTKTGGFNKKFSIAMDYDFFYRTLTNKVEIKFGKTPITVMGFGGISSNKDFLLKRLNEEYCIQKTNENNIFWKISQKVFRLLYHPYKIRILPNLTTFFQKYL